MFSLFRFFSVVLMVFCFTPSNFVICDSSEDVSVTLFDNSENEQFTFIVTQLVYNMESSLLTTSDNVFDAFENTMNHILTDAFGPPIDVAIMSYSDEMPESLPTRSATTSTLVTYEITYELEDTEFSTWDELFYELSIEVKQALTNGEFDRDIHALGVDELSKIKATGFVNIESM